MSNTMRIRLLALILLAPVLDQIRAEPLRVDVDTTQMHRHLLTSTTFLPAKAGEFAFWHPSWIPGIHGPSEQIRNIGGLSVIDKNGQRLDWRRDATQLNRFVVDVPADTTLRVELIYLANQPTRVSTGVDSYGNAELVVVNFNTCIVYPDATDLREQEISARVLLPANFQLASALPFQVAEGQWRQFETTTVETLVDSPFIASPNYRRLDVEVPDFPPTSYHFMAESAKALQFDEEQAEHYRQLMAEAAVCFGGAPYPRYDFLVVCSDRIPRMGLEHHASSLNVISEEAVTDDDKKKGSSVYLLAHELVHAWCGKYRRPAGMYRADYHTPKVTSGLWIYEGLTQYLGHILTVRAGFLTFEEHLERTAQRIGYLSNRAGREWRALEDTAIAAHTLRGGSNSWNDLRRNQDYYDEGAFFWMEADAIIRKQTQGQRSLDDFCRSFFAFDPRYPKVKPFELAEVVSRLAELTPYDWSGLIQRRISSAQSKFSLDGLQTAGYRFELVPEKSAYLKLREGERETISAEFSLGLTLQKDGQVQAVIPGSPADVAGMADRLKVIGVNGMKFNAKRLEQALQDAQHAGKIELLAEDGEAFQTIQIDYRGGPRFPALQRIRSEADIYREICAAASK